MRAKTFVSVGFAYLFDFTKVVWQIDTSPGANRRLSATPGEPAARMSKCYGKTVLHKIAVANEPPTSVPTVSVGWVTYPRLITIDPAAPAADFLPDCVDLLEPGKLCWMYRLAPAWALEEVANVVKVA